MQQVGGSHYTGLKIQPVEFAMANNYDPCAFSILKYVTRHRAKNGLEDLRKGEHFVLLRQKLEGRISYPTLDTIPVMFYCSQNDIPVLETQILLRLHLWSRGREKDIATAVRAIRDRLDSLARATYGEPL